MTTQKTITGRIKMSRSLSKFLQCGRHLDFVLETVVVVAARNDKTSARLVSTNLY